MRNFGGGGAVFYGPYSQRGYGLGGLKRWFRWIVPMVQQHALPVLKDLGRTALHSIGEFSKDVSEGRNLTEAASSHINNAVKNIKEKVVQKLRGEGKLKNFSKVKNKRQIGQGCSIKKINASKKKRPIQNTKKPDIFD